MQKLKVERSPALDIVRCFALLCVVSVHFFLNTSYYSTPVVGTEMYFMTLIRTGAMICVPLFMMLSGYLMCHKKPTPSYFSKIGKTLGTYTLAGIACVLYMAICWNKSYTFSGILTLWLNYALDPYGWYIEIYIGLFLIAPFLNLAYNHCDSQRTKKMLVAVMIFMTSLPAVTNIYEFSSLQWWCNPAQSANYVELLPAWWVSIYPVTFYFLGCYLREYPLKISRWVKLLLMAVIWVLSGSFAYYRSYGVNFISGSWTQYYSFFTLVQCVLVFDFLAQERYEKTGRITRRVLAYMSEWSLGAYLLSYIFDTQLYSMLRAQAPTAVEQLPYYIIIVPTVYAVSLLASGLLNVIQRCMGQEMRKAWKSYRDKVESVRKEGKTMRFCVGIAAAICAMFLGGSAVWQSLPACDNPVLRNLAGISACVVLLFLFLLGRRQFIRGRKKVGLYVTAVALIMAVVGTTLVFESKPAALMGKTEVIITCGEKNEASKGYEVWITDYKVNGVKQPIQLVTVLNHENVNMTENQAAWLYANVDGSGSGQITFEFEANTGKKELILVKHAWSGIVEVKANNGADPFSVDLYSETGDQYVLEIPEGPMKPVWSVVMLLAGYALIFVVALFLVLYSAWHMIATAWSKALRIVRKTKQRKILSANSIDVLLMGAAAAAVPFHYLLFLFTNNSGEIIFSSLISLALIVSGLALAAYIVMYTATRHPLSAFAAGAMVSVLMFVTGYADDLVRKNCTNENTAIITLCIVGGACALLLLPLLLVKHKRVSEVRLSTILISIVSVMLLIFNVPKALDINQMQQENLGLQYIKTEFNVDSSITDRPNVYWLHCDSMLGFDAYEKYYGDDQAAFEQNLQARGFKINRSAMFEGGHTTTVCLPSLTCPDFYDEYVTPRIVDEHLETWMGHPDGIALQSVASTMRANLEITNAFRSVGYTVALNTANWSGGIYFADADEKYESPDGVVITRSIDQRTGGVRTANAGGTENFAEAFVRPLRWAMAYADAISEAPEIVAKVDGAKVNRAEGATLTVVYADPLIAPEDGKARFVFIVFNDAHTPFDINENGEKVSEGNTNVMDYVPAHRFSQKVVLTMIDSIVAKDPNAVIIIQADHGLHGNTREDFIAAFGEDAQEKELWNCVISGIRVPEQYSNGEEQFAVANPLNMSRYLVNRFVGQNYEYLPANEPMVQ